MLWTAEGAAFFDFLGQAVSGAGDVDLDGTPDVVSGAGNFDPDLPDGTVGNLVSNAGRMYVFSGSTGATIQTYDGETAGDLLGTRSSGAGDVDFDGHADIVSGAFSYDLPGIDGTLGTPDDLLKVGRVYVYSGKGATTLYTIDGENAFDNQGFSQSGVGDVDGDGYADFASAAPAYNLDPDGTPGNLDDVSDVGRVYVFSGFDGTTLLHTFEGENEDDILGVSVTVAGDVDGDGTPDILAGAPFWSEDLLGPDGTGGTNATNTGDEKPWNGRVYVYSGFDGTTLLTKDGEQSYTLLNTGNGRHESQGDQLGRAVCAVGDMNSDGVSDILAGSATWADFSDPGRAGADGTVGTTDDLKNHGRAYAISGAPLFLTADAHELSLSVANSQTMTIDAGVPNAGKNYWLFTGFAASGDTPGVTMAPGVVIPLNQPDPLTSFVIGLTQLGGGAPTFAGWKSTLTGSGKATPSLNTFGPTPAPLGITLHHAALVYTSNGCGAGCDTFQLATNWVPMTTTP